MQNLLGQNIEIKVFGLSLWNSSSPLSRRAFIKKWKMNTAHTTASALYRANCCISSDMVSVAVYEQLNRGWNPHLQSILCHYGQHCATAVNTLQEKKKKKKHWKRTQKVQFSAYITDDEQTSWKSKSKNKFLLNMYTKKVGNELLINHWIFHKNRAPHSSTLQTAKGRGMSWLHNLRLRARHTSDADLTNVPRQCELKLQATTSRVARAQPV